jgi:hypothetical protein
MEEGDIFEAPNLQIMNADRHADISWDHADCIESYVLKVCQTAYTDCIENKVEPSGYKNINYRLEDLEPCTQYSLEVIPRITGKLFTAGSNDFTTTNGTPQAPQNFKAVLEGRNARLTWDVVQCSTGYKVYYKTDEPEMDENERDVNDLSVKYDDLVPCSIYYYSVATLVDEQASDKTQWQSVLVPPNLMEPPVLRILNNENDNITMKLDPSDSNVRCSVKEFEVSYSKNGAKPFVTEILPATSGDLVVSFPGASSPHSIVQARIRYADGLWSEVASSREPGDHSRISQIPTGSATLVPIVVGLILALVILVLVIIFVVRRRRAQSGYDAEKGRSNGQNGTGAMQGSEETQKLNEHPNA